MKMKKVDFIKSMLPMIISCFLIYLLLISNGYFSWEMTGGCILFAVFGCIIAYIVDVILLGIKYE